MSKITILNQTDNQETVRIAIYKKPVVRPTLQTIAWQIVNPPPGGQTVVEIPSAYTLFAEYSKDPHNPASPQYTTNKVEFSEMTARFAIDDVPTQDRHESGASIEQQFDNLVMNEVRVVNNYTHGVWGHIQKDGVDIYPPQVIWPGGLLMEDVRSFLYLAVISQFTSRGDMLVQEEISLTETGILEGGTATVTGSMWTGYQIEAD